jgi:hypothetical protein
MFSGLAVRGSADCSANCDGDRDTCSFADSTHADDYTYPHTHAYSHPHA